MYCYCYARKCGGTRCPSLSLHAYHNIAFIMYILYDMLWFLFTDFNPVFEWVCVCLSLFLLRFCTTFFILLFQSKCVCVAVHVRYALISIFINILPQSQWNSRIFFFETLLFSWLHCFCPNFGHKYIQLQKRYKSHLNVCKAKFRTIFFSLFSFTIFFSPIQFESWLITMWSKDTWTKMNGKRISFYCFMVERKIEEDLFLFGRSMCLFLNHIYFYTMYILTWA